MTKYIGLAPDGAAFRVLSFLYHLGGTASADRLTHALWLHFRSKPSLHRVAIEPLLKRQLITLGKISAQIVITQAGRAMVESFPSQLPAVAVGPSAPIRGIDLQKFYANVGGRPGSLEYRDIPSLMCDERVPFRSGKA
jgi:hypothetical protein